MKFDNMDLSNLAKVIEALNQWYREGISFGDEPFIQVYGKGVQLTHDGYEYVWEFG